MKILDALIAGNSYEVLEDGNKLKLFINGEQKHTFPFQEGKQAAAEKAVIKTVHAYVMGEANC